MDRIKSAPSPARPPTIPHTGVRNNKPFTRSGFSPAFSFHIIKTILLKKQKKGFWCLFQLLFTRALESLHQIISGGLFKKLYGSAKSTSLGCISNRKLLQTGVSLPCLLVLCIAHNKQKATLFPTALTSCSKSHGNCIFTST